MKTYLGSKAKHLSNASLVRNWKSKTPANFESKIKNSRNSERFEARKAAEIEAKDFLLSNQSLFHFTKGSHFADSEDDWQDPQDDPSWDYLMNLADYSDPHTLLLQGDPMIYHGNIRTSTLKAPPAAITELHGSLFVDTDTTFPNLVKVTGPIRVLASAKFPSLKECSSMIVLRAPTELPALELALGLDVHINDFTTDLPSLLVVGAEELLFRSPINAPRLEKLLGNLEAHFPASLPSLRYVEGNAYLDASTDLPKLETVRCLDISAESKLPVLHTVEQNLITRVDLDLPELKLIGEDLHSTKCRYTGFVSEHPSLNFPKLKTVCRSITLSPGTALNAPNLESVGGNLMLGEVFVAPKLRSVLGCFKVGRTNFDHSATTFKAGKVIAVSDYALHVSDSGLYSAGCRGPWTAAKALCHWNDKHSTPARATLFKEAILLHESSK